jgi:hypothetical protein
MDIVADKRPSGDYLNGVYILKKPLVLTQDLRNIFEKTTKKFRNGRFA